jgi:Ni/Fe-hydrogenase 1 B-type cytochrome subunit
MVAHKLERRQESGAAGRSQELHAFRAWDAPTRWFHWINATLFIALMIVGLAMLTGRWFGIGDEGRDQLERVHIALGGALAINLLWRAYWAFRGNRTAQWRAVLPGGPGYWRDLRAYLWAFVAGHPRYYIGHSPLARLGVAVLLVLLTVQILSGLVLVGIDQLAPPAVQALTAPGVTSPIDVQAPALPWAIPWSAADAAAWRAPLHAIHFYGFFVLVIAVIQHLVAVITTELREGGDLVSAMFTGWKSFPRRPEDAEPPSAAERKQGRRRQ